MEYTTEKNMSADCTEGESTEKVGILDVVSHYGDIEIRSFWVGQCPRCKTQKSLIVDEERERFICTYCQLSGDKISFICAAEGLPTDGQAAFHLLSSGKYSSGKEQLEKPE
jgi:CHC2-type zinc finger protein